MVSPALLLLTVSTLAAHCYAFPKVLRPECKEGAECDTKPNGYPQEDIDRMVLKHLPHLQRIKREVGDWERVPSKKDGNCPIRTRKVQLINAEKATGLPQVIVHSKWLNQTLTEVACAEDTEPSTKGCLSAYTLTPIPTKCETKYMRYDLVLYDEIRKENMPPEHIDFGVDCACVLSDA